MAWKVSALAEELHLVETFLTSYNNAKIHFASISTESSVAMLLEAKQNNINVSSSVAIHNLILTDNTLSDFDSNYKVLPPLRSTTDQKTLVEGLKEGIIDVITLDHYPHEIEAKKKGI